eukprot:365534-Chlamydomonas_euryale.AAC.14
MAEGCAQGVAGGEQYPFHGKGCWQRDTLQPPRASASQSRAPSPLGLPCCFPLSPSPFPHSCLTLMHP